MYQLCVFIHILMAAVWIGGLIYTAAIVVPFAVGHDKEERQRILRSFGRRFRPVAWSAAAIGVLTGFGNLLLRLTPIDLHQIISGEIFDPHKVDRFIATWLPWKVAFVVVMLILMLFHDVTSVQAARKFEGSRDSAPGNRAGTMAASIALIMALFVLYFSVRLVRG
ncbi:MAG: hypothetical protein DMF61_13305 [Blastocatellia bacterium AA13]|nr:MAG: hypothetical protein DMF61_13305 [Blastocatellia bacterium AA13]